MLGRVYGARLLLLGAVGTGCFPAPFFLGSRDSLRAPVDDQPLRSIKADLGEPPFQRDTQMRAMIKQQLLRSHVAGRGWVCARSPEPRGGGGGAGREAGPAGAGPG